MSPVALSSLFLNNLFRMSNNSGKATKAFPCVVLTSPDDVAALTRVSFVIVSTSRSEASTVSIAGNFLVPGWPTDKV